MIWTRVFWLDLTERAIKTFAQSLLAMFAVDGVSWALDVPWLQGLSVAALAALVSALTSLASAVRTTAGPVATPSLVDTRNAPPGGPGPA